METQLHITYDSLSEASESSSSSPNDAVDIINSNGDTNAPMWGHYGASELPTNSATAKRPKSQSNKKSGHKKHKISSAFSEDEDIIPTTQYPCDVCGFSFANPNALRRHVVTLTALTYTCLACRTQLMNHNFDVMEAAISSRAKHDLRLCKLKDKTMCTLCKKFYKTEKEAIVHIRLHCLFCQKMVTTFN